MNALRELQFAFAEALLTDNSERIAQHILLRDPPLDRLAMNRLAIDRLAIYRNNVAIGFAKALAAQFPVIQELGGDAWFSHVADCYRRRHPSTTGNLFRVGARFPRYLSGMLRTSHFAYFADVARLEWACHEVQAAEKPAPFDLRELNHLTSRDYAYIRFQLRPSIRLVKSKYSILTLWRAHRSQTDLADIQRLDVAQCVCVGRSDGQLALTELSLGDYVLLRAFAKGLILREALELASENDSSFEAEIALPRLAQLDVFASVSLGRSQRSLAK